MKFRFDGVFMEQISWKCFLDADLTVIDLLTSILFPYQRTLSVSPFRFRGGEKLSGDQSHPQLGLQLLKDRRDLFLQLSSFV